MKMDQEPDLGEPPHEPTREEQEGDAWEYWHQRASKLEADLHATLKAVLYHFGPEGALKVSTSALASRTDGAMTAQKDDHTPISRDPLSTAPPAPAPEGGEIETALRQVWSDWEIAADAAEVDDYQIKDVAPETVEAVAHALGFLLPAPRTPQTACLGGVEGLTSEPCPKCGATEDDDCKAPFPAPPAPTPEGEWRPDVDEIARAICGHPRGCQLALGLCDQCKDDINVLGVLKAAARVAAVPAPPVAEPIVAEEKSQL